MRSHLAPMVVALAVLVPSLFATASVPQTLSYQGVLRDGGGNVVPDAEYDLTFRIYDVVTGGSDLWEETQTVTTAGGIFGVILGSSTPVNLPFDVPYWLGISIGADSELVPRTALTSAPYAMHAGSAATAAGAPPDADWTVSGNDMYSGVSGDVGIGTASPQDKLEVKGVLRLDSGAGNSNILRFVDGGTMKWALLYRPWVNGNLTVLDEVSLARAITFESGTGDVGIKTEHPEADLHVIGDTRLDGGLEVNGEITRSAAARRVSVMAPDFVPAPASATNYTIATALVVNLPDQVTFYAPIHLPDGATITSVTHHYDDVSSTYDIDCDVRRSALDGSGSSIIADVPSSGSGGSGSTTDTTVDHPVVDLSAYNYVARLVGRGGIESRGLTVEYTTTVVD